MLFHCEFADWLARFLSRFDLEPTRVANVTGGKLRHLAGLNFSRAWMLDGILTRLRPPIPTVSPGRTLRPPAASQRGRHKSGLPGQQAAAWR
jgi:hypothetical protein